MTTIYLAGPYLAITLENGEPQCLASSALNGPADITGFFLAFMRLHMENRRKTAWFIMPVTSLYSLTAWELLKSADYGQDNREHILTVD